MINAFIIFLTIVLILCAIIFARSQFKSLGWLNSKEQLPPEDRRYFRKRAYRRLVGCILMLVLAFLLGGLYFFNILTEIDELEALADQVEPGELELNAEQMATFRFALVWVWSIIVTLFILFGLVVLDMAALRRYGMRQRNKINQDRQAMLRRQLPQLRRSRNGSH